MIIGEPCYVFKSPEVHFPWGYYMVSTGWMYFRMLFGMLNKKPVAYIFINGTYVVALSLMARHYRHMEINY